MAELVRRAVFSYSLSSLYLLSSFSYFPFFQPPQEAYYRHAEATQMYATLLLVAMLGLVIFATIQWVSRWEKDWILARRVLDGALVLSMLIPVRHLILMMVMPRVTERTEALLWISLRIVIAACAMSVIFWKARWSYRAVVGTVVLVSPLYPMCLVRAMLWRSSPVATPPPSASRLQTRLAQRVAWVVFDETDALALERKGTPADLALPEFDRLRNESVSAQRAYPTGPATLMSIPAMLTGQLAKDLRLTGPRELSVQWEGKPDWESFGKQWTLFRGVRQLGGNAALTGWYHPYCDIFAADLVDCYSEPYNYLRAPSSGGNSIWGHMVFDLGMTLRAVPLVARLRLATADEPNRTHASRLDNLVGRAIKQLSDPRNDFVYAHLCVPHDPGIYNRRTRSYSADGSYYDNLALTDVVLGKLRRAMEAAGVWDTTTVIVTSDHSWRYPPDREQDPRVPLFLKFARSMGAAQAYLAPVSTLILAPLTMELLQGRIHTVAEATGFMQGRHTVIDSSRLVKKAVDERWYSP